MQATFTNDVMAPLEIDVAGKFVEFRLPPDMKSGKAMARLIAGSAWGAAVIRFDGSVADADEVWQEIASGNRLSAEQTLSTEIDLTCIRRLRAVVQTASTTSGARAVIYLCVQNPNYK